MGITITKAGPLKTKMMIHDGESLKDTIVFYEDHTVRKLDKEESRVVEVYRQNSIHPTEILMIVVGKDDVRYFLAMGANYQVERVTRDLLRPHGHNR